MKIFNINFHKNKKKAIVEKNSLKKCDRYDEIGKLVKEARIRNNLSIKELSQI